LSPWIETADHKTAASSPPAATLQLRRRTTKGLIPKPPSERSYPLCHQTKPASYLSCQPCGPVDSLGGILTSGKEASSKDQNGSFLIQQGLHGTLERCGNADSKISQPLSGNRFNEVLKFWGKFSKRVVLRRDGTDRISVWGSRADGNVQQRKACRLALPNSTESGVKGLSTVPHRYHYTVYCTTAWESGVGWESPHINPTSVFGF